MVTHHLCSCVADMRKRARAEPDPSDDEEEEKDDLKHDSDEEEGDEEEGDDDLPDLAGEWSGWKIGGEQKNDEEEEEEGEGGEGKEEKREKKRDKKAVPGLDDAKWEAKTWPASFEFTKEKEQPTPAGTFRSGATRTHHFLLLFFTQALWLRLRTMTNLRAKQKKLKGWQDLDIHELRAWVSINIFMGIHRLPNVRMYWNKQFGVDRVREVMIKSCWSFTDATKEPARGSPNYDPFYKVRPVIDVLNAEFPRCWRPGRWLCVERMVAFKGRHEAKQYMKNKPTKWGWKLWQLGYAKSSFTLHISAYLGSASASDSKKEEALGTEVVCTLVEPYKETGRAVVVDNFFSSVDLAQKLWLMGIGMAGTVNANRRGMPVQFRGAELKAAKKEIKRGEYKVVQSGDLRVTLWSDRAAVLFISSAVCDPRGDTFVLRWINGPERERVPCPPVADLYNTYMHGVDRSDQLQSYYPPGQKQLRWQAALTWELIDKCIVNAWILRKGDPLMEEMTHLDFRLQLVLDLIDNYSNRQRPGPKPAPRVGRHQLVKLDKRASCAVCATASQRVRTFYSCKHCDVHVCPTCYDQHMRVVV